MTLTAKTNRDVTLRVGPFAKLPEVLTSLGYDPRPIFHECGFQLKRFQHVDSRIPYIQASQLITRCVEITGASHLGILLAQSALPSHLGLSGFLAQSAPTVEEALNCVVENLDLHEEGGVINLEKTSTHSILSYNLLIAGVDAAEQVYDLAAGMMYRILQTLCGDSWQADSISLTRRSPADITPYRQFFNTQIYFNATECAVTFSNDWLGAVPQGHDDLLHQHLAEEANALHENQNHNLMDALPACLYKALMAGQFSSEEVAARLGMHERTLHRRLKEAGTSFRYQLDKARFALGRQLLGSTNLPVCDIAATLGYSDSSGFIRAFQRWCGTSPAAWRGQFRAAKENSREAS